MRKYLGLFEVIKSGLRHIFFGLRELERHRKTHRERHIFIDENIIIDGCSFMKFLKDDKQKRYALEYRVSVIC